MAGIERADNARSRNREINVHAKHPLVETEREPFDSLRRNGV